MKILQDYKQAVFRLAVEFEKHKDPEFWYELFDWLSFPWHFPWDDYGMYCDSSEYYSWTPSDMYWILSKNIPYEIACEHFDISVWELWGDLPHYNLDYYYSIRKDNMDMSLVDILKHLNKLHEENRARVNSPEFKEETKRIMEEAFNKFKLDIWK